MSNLTKNHLFTLGTFFARFAISSVLTGPGYKDIMVTPNFFNSIPQSPAILSHAAFIIYCLKIKITEQ